MKSNRPYRLIVSGGGTGGHIFPAIAIATCFKEKYPNSEILFVGAKGKLEMTKVPEAGFKIAGLWVSGWNRKASFSTLLFPLKLLFSLCKAKHILSHFKPDVVVGTGGYASGPITLVAGWKKIPILIQEQNSYAGLTNRWIAKKAKKICVAYPHMKRYFPSSKIVFTGNPVQKSMLNLQEKKQLGLDYFSLNDTDQTLLVIGGSLGAKTINESILFNLDKLIEARVQVLWQTGKIYYNSIKEKTIHKNLGKIQFYEFIKRMDLAYAVSHIVVSRSGALTISEMCVGGKATILVPSPNVAEDHQTKNAHALIEEHAAVVVNDSDARHGLVDEALKLLQDAEKSDHLRANISRLAKPEATQHIVSEIEKLIECN